MKRVIVFGGTGWLGHNIVLELRRQGAEVTIATRGKKAAFLEEVADIPQVTVDKTDEAAMKDLFAHAHWDAVIDSVPTSASLALVVKYAVGIDHYVHCSSTGGYAPLPFIPCDEAAPHLGFNQRAGWSKKAIVDAEALDHFNRAGFPATVIRPCYITGPGLLPLDNLGGRRPEFLPSLKAGKEMPLPDDGQALLQPIHVLDLARSFALALAHPQSIGQVYNITLDHAVPLNRYLQLNAEAIGGTANIVHVPLAELLRQHPEDPVGLSFFATHMCFTNAKAKAQLGFTPHCTPEEAIRETARWGIEHL